MAFRVKSHDDSSCPVVIREDELAGFHGSVLWRCRTYFSWPGIRLSFLEWGHSSSGKERLETLEPGLSLLRVHEIVELSDCTLNIDQVD